MSQDNVAVVEDAYRAFARDGLDGFLQHWTDDLDHRNRWDLGVVFTIRDGEIAKGREYATREQALEGRRVSGVADFWPQPQPSAQGQDVILDK